MNKFALLSSLCLILCLAAPLVWAQDPTLPAPTLVPPTLVPTIAADSLQVADYSGIVTLQSEGVLRVGAQYNQRPFSYLDEFGQLVGYEVEVLEALGVELGVQIEWVQLTAENERDELAVGRVDALISQQTHTRDSSQFLEYAHPYYLNKQRLVVREGDPYQNFEELRGQSLSVVRNSTSEIAAQSYLEAFGWQLLPFFTEKEALDALERGEVAGMVGELDNLSRAGRQGMRYIEQPIRLDPYAIAIRRYDVNLRNALNRALQRLFASGRLGQIYDRWFSEPLDFDVLIPVYKNVFDDARTIFEMNTDIPQPANQIVERIRAGETLQVAGLSQNPNAPAYDRLLDPLNRAIMDELARRWGVAVNYLPDSAANSVELLVSGQAMIAIGVTPRWDGADRFDYSRPYAARGERLMVLEGSRFGSFGDFRGGSDMGFWYESPEHKDRILAIADALRVNTTPYELRSHEEIINLFKERNIDGIFGDILRLRAIIENTRNSGLPWKILPEEYSREPVVIALPRNDANFRALVDWTLQDMFLDGTYQQIYRDTYGEGEPLVMLTWTGDGSWLVTR